jgi:hypothetical protein
MALVTYLAMGLSGFLYMTRANHSSSLQDLTGSGVMDIWATILTLSGFAAFYFAVSAKFSARPEGALRGESYASLSIGLCITLYLVSLFVVHGSSALTTGIFSGVFALGAILRFAQVTYELHRIKNARANPAKSDPVLAEPHDKHET